MIKKLAKFVPTIIPAFLLFACGGADLPEKEFGKTVPVKVHQAEVQPLGERLVYSGTVEAIDRIRLSTKIMGWVEKIYFEEGEKAAEGETLVKLRSKDLEAKQAQAQAAIAEAEVHFKNTQTNLKRIESLFEKGAATQKELDDMRAAFASARARKISAEKMKIEVDEILKYSNISAPFDGVVTRKMLQAGDLANPGQPILEFENSSEVRIVAKVPESDIQNLQAGTPVRIQVQASKIGTNGKSVEGSIDKIVPSADPMSRQFDIHVIIDNPDGAIKTGMFARVATGKGEDAALMVPKTAVFRRGQLEGVFIVDSDDEAHLRWIRTGSEYDDLIEILSGLNPGEQVVVEGASELLDGQRVEVK